MFRAKKASDAVHIAEGAMDYWIWQIIFRRRRGNIETQNIPIRTKVDTWLT